MPEFHTVARVGEIPAGEGRSYQGAGRMVAVFFVDDEYTAIVAPFTLPSRGVPAVPAPWFARNLPAAKKPLRIALADFPLDGGENRKIRRGYVILFCACFQGDFEAPSANTDNGNAQLLVQFFVVSPAGFVRAGQPLFKLLGR